MQRGKERGKELYSSFGVLQRVYELLYINFELEESLDMKFIEGL